MQAGQLTGVEVLGCSFPDPRLAPPHPLLQLVCQVLAGRNGDLLHEHQTATCAHPDRRRAAGFHEGGTGAASPNRSSTHSFPITVVSCSSPSPLLVSLRCVWSESACD